MRRLVLLLATSALAGSPEAFADDDLVGRVAEVADRAMKALAESSRLARPRWEADLGIACFEILKRMATEDCAERGSRTPDASAACVREWVEERPQFTATLAGHSTTVPYREGAARACNRLAEERMQDFFQ